MHVPPSGPALPALHLQSVMEMLPAGESAWAGHVAQMDSDVAAGTPEYFPDPQATQGLVPAAALYFPA